MDSLFMADEVGRWSFLRYLINTFGCTYICLWRYLPHPSNCLSFLDGFYQEETSNQQPSSSSSDQSLGKRLFNQYCKSVFYIVDNRDDRVPGMAFKKNSPYVEIKELELLKLASLEVQLHFYQAARIKTAVFMGCKSGEIELGMPHVPQVNMEMEMKTWFPEDFSRRPSPPKEILQLTAEQNPLSSSSSSLRSVSMDSPDQSSSFLFNINPTSSYIAPEAHEDVSPISPVLPPISIASAIPASTSAGTTPTQLQVLGQMGNILFPSLDSDMTRAMLAVISSHSSSSSCLLQRTSAFEKYRSPLGAKPHVMKASSSKSNSTSSAGRRRSMAERAVAYFGSLYTLQRMNQNAQMQVGRPNITQLQHMISERKRREKLNESFQALKSLLPPGSKRDKASVLASTRDHLSSLKAQVSELRRRNEQLEAQILQRTSNEAAGHAVGSSGTPPPASGERIDVQIASRSESTEDQETSFTLRVSVRGECSLLDLTTRILEFLKRVGNMSLVSMEAESTRMGEAPSSAYNVMTVRLKVEGNEWDESAFREAVRRVVADVAK